MSPRILIPFVPLAALLAFCVTGPISGTPAPVLPPALASREEAFMKICAQYGADELRVYRATLLQWQKKYAEEGDFDAAKRFKEARESMTITPELIAESLRSTDEATRTMHGTVWRKNAYRQCISPLGYMCSRTNNTWTRGNLRISDKASSPRILSFSNSNCVWMLVDQNTVVQMMMGWSCHVFQPAQDCDYASIFSEKSTQPALRVEGKARHIEEAKGILLKELGFKCKPLAKKYAAFLQSQLGAYVKRGQYDEAIQIRNRIASLAVNRRSGQSGMQADEALKSIYVQESYSSHNKIANHKTLTINRPELFVLKETKGTTTSSC